MPMLGASLIDPVRCERGLKMPAQLRSRCIQFKLPLHSEPLSAHAPEGAYGAVEAATDI
jgi:hypothetical protein